MLVAPTLVYMRSGQEEDESQLFTHRYTAHSGYDFNAEVHLIRRQQPELCIATLYGIIFLKRNEKFDRKASSVKQPSATVISHLQLL